MSSEGSSKTDGEKTLSSIFDDGHQLHDKITNSCLPNKDEDLQSDLNRAIDCLEDATRMVSMLGVFSTNENIDEVSTDNLKYFLLPVLLGNLTLRRIEPDRLEILKVAETYYKDFLERCYNYQIVKRHEEEDAPDEENRGDDRHPRSAMSDLLLKNKQRTAKIERYKEKKYMEDQIKVMSTLIKTASVDEEVKRRYHNTVTKKYIHCALDELDSIKDEIPILLHMSQMKGSKKEENPPPPRRPLKPIILTRDALQKQVFGVGYPSIPTMTIEEFARKHLPDAESCCNSQGGTVLRGEERRKKEDEEFEESQIRKQELLDADDPEALAKARNWDEFKDEHKRGEGNRANRS